MTDLQHYICCDAYLLLSLLIGVGKSVRQSAAMQLEKALELCLRRLQDVCEAHSQGQDDAPCKGAVASLDG